MGLGHGNVLGSLNFEFLNSLIPQYLNFLDPCYLWLTSA